MKIKKLWLATILGAQLAFTTLAADGTTDTNRDADIEALKQQLRELSQKVQALESQRARSSRPPPTLPTDKSRNLTRKSGFSPVSGNWIRKRRRRQPNAAEADHRPKRLYCEFGGLEFRVQPQGRLAGG